MLQTHRPSSLISSTPNHDEVLNATTSYTYQQASIRAQGVQPTLGDPHMLGVTYRSMRNKLHHTEPYITGDYQKPTSNACNSRESSIFQQGQFVRYLLKRS